MAVLKNNKLSGLSGIALTNTTAELCSGATASRVDLDLMHDNGNVFSGRLVIGNLVIPSGTNNMIVCTLPNAVPKPISLTDVFALDDVSGKMIFVRIYPEGYCHFFRLNELSSGNNTIIIHLFYMIAA